MTIIDEPKILEEELSKIDISVPIAPWVHDQHAALAIRNFKLQIEDEIEPAMAVARRRHNEPSLRTLGEQKSQLEDQIRLLFRSHPGARRVLETWAIQTEPKDV
mgnify:CR=1 FL=1